jgi:hypothetical protein
MLSTNKVIDHVTLVFSGSGSDKARALFQALTERGDGICLKRLTISWGITNYFMYGLSEFLTRWPKATTQLEILEYLGPYPEKLLEQLVAIPLESLILTANRWYSPDMVAAANRWYSLDMVAAAIEQPCCRMKGLSLLCGDDQRSNAPNGRFANALKASKSVVFFEMQHISHHFYEPDPYTIRMLSTMRNIQGLSFTLLVSCSLLPRVCRIVESHGNIKSLKLGWMFRLNDHEADMTNAFTTTLFRGIEEVTLKAKQSCHFSSDRAEAVTNTILSTISSALRDNPTIQKLALSTRKPPLNIFRAFIDTTIPSVLNLRVLECDMALDGDHANLLLAVVRRCENLQKFHIPCQVVTL